MKYIRTSLLVLASALVLASCNKDDNASGVPDSNYRDIFADGRVPVQVGGRFCEFKSKAAVNDIEGVQLGVFAADCDTVGRWSTDSLNILLYNKGGEVRNGIVDFRDTRTLASVEYYYPLVSRYDYTFYGYRYSSKTLDEDNTIFNADLYDDSLSVVIPIDTSDIIWAKSVADTLYSGTGRICTGFKASYVRNAYRWYPETYENYLPKFYLTHLTSALHFLAVAKDAYAEESFVDKVYAKTLTLTGARTSATFCIANKLDPSKEGLLLPDEESVDTVSYFGRKVFPTVAGNEIGGGFFLLPGEENLTISVVFDTPNGDVTITNKLVVPEGGYIAGKSYYYKFVINSLEGILVLADLQAWEDKDAGVVGKEIG